METHIQYQVPVSRSSVVQFVMTCPGMSHSSTFTLHMRDSGEVDDGREWGDLCRIEFFKFDIEIHLHNVLFGECTN